MLDHLIDLLRLGVALDSGKAYSQLEEEPNMMSKRMNLTTVSLLRRPGAIELASGLAASKG